MSPNLKSHVYRGESINVSYNIHAEKCVRRLGEVFDLNKRPCIQLDQAYPEQIADMIPHFPSGALYYERLDGGSDEEFPTVNIIMLQEDGPLYLSGNRGQLRIILQLFDLNINSILNSTI